MTISPTSTPMTPPTSDPVTSRGRRLQAGLSYAAIILTTLVLLDVACIALGILPPRINPGDPDLGWRPAPATGRRALGKCTEFSTREVVTYTRNEDGIRTNLSRAALLDAPQLLKVAVTGDSHTDLCATNEETHAGVLEADLLANGTPAAVLGYGSGRYSPLQEYLAFQVVLKPYQPRVLVMNLYTGNDFYDLLRSDDRPHFESTDSGYVVAPPRWYAYDDPTSLPKSRVLYALRQLADKGGVRSLYYRLSELRRLGDENGGGITTVLAYMGSLWEAREPGVGYPDAFSAQMLNQQLFFHYFPSAEQESLKRLDALLALARRQNPDLILVLSPIPSYELVGEQPVDPLLLETLSRLPVSHAEGLAQEGRLYDSLRNLASDNGWIFVDNLKALRAYHGTQRLFNNFDYHILPPASALIGSEQATAILAAFGRPRTSLAVTARSR